MLTKLSKKRIKNLNLMEKKRPKPKFLLFAILSLFLVNGLVAFTPIASAATTPYTKLVSLDAANYHVAEEGGQNQNNLPPINVEVGGDQGASFFNRDTIIIIVIAFAVLIVVLLFVVASSRK